MRLTAEQRQAQITRNLEYLNKELAVVSERIVAKHNGKNYQLIDESFTELEVPFYEVPFYGDYVSVDLFVQGFVFGRQTIG